MTRSLLLIVGFALVSGCASGPTTNVSPQDSQPQTRKTVQAEPLTESEAAQMANARLAIDAENWEKAAALLTDLKARRPNVSEIHARLGWVAKEQGDRQAAITAYRKAFALDPYDAVSANNLALLLKEQARFQEAASLLQEGLGYSPQVAELHYNLAVICELYLLDLERALTHYRQFSELSDQDGQQVAGWIADLERRLN